MNIISNPVIVGAAQFTQGKKTPKPLDPLSLMVKTSRDALADSGAAGLKEFIDSVYMININSWSYEDAPGELSKLIGVNPVNKVFLPAGGDTPQMLVNRAAKEISSGDIKSVIITGGESAYSAYLEKKGKISLNWPERKEPKYMEGKPWNGTNAFENYYGFKNPPHAYALFETALRASAGRSIDEHRKSMGRLFERFSKVAFKNPFAWTKEIYNSDEITTPTPENRKINNSYTKRMCANMFVDQSASLIMTSEKIAEKLGIDKKLWVYLMGGSDLKDIHEITRRPRLYASPAASTASQLALEQAGLKLKDINAFDIYSCFPSIVEITRNELGLTESDPRDLTVAGSLPFFGGPLSNYSMHAIVSAVNLIRKTSSLNIMVIANGGLNTKKSVGIYGTKPPLTPWSARDDTSIQQSILAKTLPEPVKEASGELTIEAYIITYNRTRNPKRGVVIGRLEDGRRTLANIDSNPEELLRLEREELVGKTGKVYHDAQEGRNFVQININD